MIDTESFVDAFLILDKLTPETSEGRDILMAARLYLAKQFKLSDPWPSDITIALRHAQSYKGGFRDMGEWIVEDEWERARRAGKRG